MTRALLIPHLFWMLALAAILTTATSYGQYSEFSPYSRFGFGLVETLQTPVYASAGGLQSALSSSFQFNPANPASASALGQTTFQGSSVTTFLSLDDGENNANAVYGSPGPLGIAIKEQGGKNTLILGLAPYAQSGYGITRLSEFNNVGTVRETYDGQGGLSKAHLGWAHTLRGTGFVSAGSADSIRIQKHVLHLGVQTEYLFGELQRASKLDVIDPTFLDHRSRVEARHRSFSLNFGAIYDHLLYAKYGANRSFEKSASLKLGGVFTPECSLSSSILQIDEITQNIGGVDVPIEAAGDTIMNANAAGRMAMKWSGGLALAFDHQRGRRVVISIEYGESRWDQVAQSFDLDLLGEDVTWIRSKSLRSGLEWTLGDSENRHPVWGRATYRMGYAAIQQPFAIGGAPLTDRVGSAGFSLPLIGSRSLSRFHFGMEFGTRSATENELAESFARMHIGVSLMPFFKNNWLRERLYD